MCTKPLALLLACCLLITMLPVFAAADAAGAPPKYVFMFIGDGMGLPLITAAQYYLGVMEDPTASMPVSGQLSFTQFPCLGMVTTYDASSFCPDSSSTATSMASGEKILSQVVNYSVDETIAFKPITEYAKEAGKKIGIITSVSLDHATPAAYYAKAKERTKYYKIAMQGLTGTTLDFLAGGGFLDSEKKTNADGSVKREDLFDLARANGWTVVNSNEGIRALTADSGRVLAINPVLQDSQAMTFEIDRLRRAAQGEDILPLSELVAAGIRTLDNKNGFFLMCEGGKIDWASHANDAAASIYETIAFSDAVQVAVDFAAAHPDETLIIVTADHETGGMSVGYAVTKYDTHFEYLSGQSISYVAFDEIVAQLRESHASFEEALEQIRTYYGLTTEPEQPLSLTEEEVDALRSAYALNVIGEMQEHIYCGHQPLSVTVSHILAHKAGLSYSSYAHTGMQVPLYALGVGAEAFSGLYDNTEIFDRTMRVMGLIQE